MIAALLPSRGRPDAYRNSRDSLLDTTDSRLRVLVRLDDDDPLRLLYSDACAYIAYGPRYGYTRLHDYYNELAALVRADYLLLWNDDALMLTDGWDRKLATLDPSVPFVATPGGTDHPFPVISRAFYDALGHFSLSAHCDHWVCEIGKAAGCMVDLGPVQIDHLRDELDDETKREGVAAQENVTLPALKGPGLQHALARDIEKVRAALAVTA